MNLPPAAVGTSRHAAFCCFEWSSERKIPTGSVETALSRRQWGLTESCEYVPYVLEACGVSRPQLPALGCIFSAGPVAGEFCQSAARSNVLQPCFLSGSQTDAHAAPPSFAAFALKRLQTERLCAGVRMWRHELSLLPLLNTLSHDFRLYKTGQYKDFVKSWIFNWALHKSWVISWGLAVWRSMARRLNTETEMLKAWRL